MTKTPRFTDGRGRYINSEKSKEPGYLARRFKAYRRLQRMKARRCNVTQIQERKAANGKAS